MGPEPVCLVRGGGDLATGGRVILLEDLTDISTLEAELQKELPQTSKQ